MKCKICDRKTNWDESYGREDFIVCPHCFELLKKRFKGDLSFTMGFIFTLGDIAKKSKSTEDEG